MTAITMSPAIEPTVLGGGVDERAARASLRVQIARLERKLGLTTMELWEAGGRESPPGASLAGGAARLVSLGELEETRDALVDKLAGARRVLEARAAASAQAHVRLEAMLADPAAHRYEVVRHEELGEPSCGAYHVLPRLGLLGMLFGWWCVKLSSGCP